MPEPGLPEPEAPGPSVPAARRLGIAMAYVALVAVGAAATFFALGGVRSTTPDGRGGTQVQPLSDDEAAGLVTSPRATRTATAGPSATAVPTPTPTAGPTVPGGTGGGGSTGGGSTGGGGTGVPVNPPTTTSPPPPPTTEPPPPPTQVQVPHVLGFSRNVADQQLRAAGLVTSWSQQGSADKCYVIEQSPAGGIIVAPGSTVFVVEAILLGPVCKLM